MLVDRRSRKVLEVLKVEPKYFTRLARSVGVSNRTLDNRVEDLIKGGFVEEEREEVFPFKRIFSITKKGKFALDSLKELGEV